MVNRTSVCPSLLPLPILRPACRDMIKSIRNFYDSNLIIESCGKSIEINYFDPISRHCEQVACRRLRACWRRVSVASFVLTFSRVPLRLERKWRDGSVGLFMYFHLVCSPGFIAVVSRRKSNRKLFRQATQLIVLIDHDFVVNPTYPPFAFLPCPFRRDISLPLGKRRLGVFRYTACNEDFSSEIWPKWLWRQVSFSKPRAI